MTDPHHVPPDTTLLGDEHVRRYRETAGEVGYLWNGATALLLTTTGGKSGLPRTQPLIFAAHGEDFLVVASLGGAPNHPAWYLNLLANPAAEIQVKGDLIKVTGRTADDDEKPGLWKIVTDQWPNYNVYQARTERIIPLVVLSPVTRQEAS